MKLVRDKIPEIIKDKGRVPKTHIANDEEYRELLVEKLKEEVKEFDEHRTEEELADVLEVIRALAELYGRGYKEIETLRKRKARDRGEFKKKIVLEEVNGAHYGSPPPA
jgi:predicted house-cleaning noncanonical NTP pyrophosphatase (MazG superfamily)